MLTFNYTDAKCIVICGDIHGDFEEMVFKLCVQYGMTDTLLIVAGDCGFGFEKPGYYEQIFSKVSRRLTKANNWIAMIRGNHDDPAYLQEQTINHERFRCVPDYSIVTACRFSLSPVLWRKMPGARSAGRVQSVALRLVVERELEIKSFKSEEYWSLSNIFLSKNGEFVSNLTHIDGKKLDKLDIKNEEEAEKIRKDLIDQEYAIENISKKSVSKNSSAPFTTSTLQQDASHKLGFSTKYTMQLAQKLYEGITVNGSTTGLITYMRTDSTNLSKEAID